MSYVSNQDLLIFLQLCDTIDGKTTQQTIPNGMSNSGIKEPFNLQETKSAIGKFQILMYISIVKLMYFSCSSPLKKQAGFFMQLSYFWWFLLLKNKNQLFN